MCRLICAVVVRIWRKTGFLMMWLSYCCNNSKNFISTVLFIQNAPTWQIMKALIGLLIQEQSGLGLHCLLRPVCPKIQDFYHNFWESFTYTNRCVINLCMCIYKVSTIEILKNWTPEKFTVITLKFEQGGSASKRCRRNCKQYRP